MPAQRDISETPKRMKPHEDTERTTLLSSQKRDESDEVEQLLQELTPETQ